MHVVDAAVEDPVNDYRIVKEVDQLMITDLFFLGRGVWALWSWEIN